ncbi:MAG: hypothetical protein ACO2OS_06885 [Thermosphaera aggregans]
MYILPARPDRYFTEERKCFYDWGTASKIVAFVVGNRISVD